MEKLTMSYLNCIQSLKCTIKPIINSLRHNVLESTFAGIARTTGMNRSIERQGIAN